MRHALQGSAQIFHPRLYVESTTVVVVQPDKGVVVPERERERTRGYQLRLETAPVLPGRFLIVGVEL